MDRILSTRAPRGPPVSLTTIRAITMVRTRIFFGTLLTLIAFGVLLLDGVLARNWDAADASSVWQRMLTLGGPLLMLVLLTGLLSTREFSRLLEQRDLRPLRRWTLLIVTALIVIPWLAVILIRDPAAAARADLHWTLIALVVGVVGSSIALVLRRDVNNGLADLGGAITALVYLGLMFGFVVRLRMALPGPIGAWVVLMWILVVKFTDVGAYFTGMAVGRRPLIPAISPKKTVEGSLGGLALGILTGVIGWIALPVIRPVFEWGPVPSFLGMLISATILSVLGQFGDLVESLLKRSAAAKDSGTAIPTFGGILDVVDSLILTAPVAWILLAAWPAE